MERYEYRAGLDSGGSIDSQEHPDRNHPRRSKGAEEMTLCRNTERPFQAGAGTADGSGGQASGGSAGTDRQRSILSSARVALAQSQPPLTINGRGFGSFPNGLPYDGNSNYLEITDSTQNWDAGYGTDQCTVSIGEWSTTNISLVANVNVNGACPLAAGDQLTIKVWNPQSLGTPATYTTTVAAN